MNSSTINIIALVGFALIIIGVLYFGLKQINYLIHKNEHIHDALAETKTNHLQHI